MQQKELEQGSLAPPADGEDAAVPLDLEWAEQPELDARAAALLHGLKRAVSGS